MGYYVYKQAIEALEDAIGDFTYLTPVDPPENIDEQNLAYAAHLLEEAKVVLMRDNGRALKQLAKIDGLELDEELEVLPPDVPELLTLEEIAAFEAEAEAANGSGNPGWLIETPNPEPAVETASCDEPYEFEGEPALCTFPAGHEGEHGPAPWPLED